ncbi:hypothetical protein XA68_10768 [Ophiocordyceps unilateralis]|uniref:Acid phosphatase n=1 Tax=Ophiocordyceps unilateralis TaxID=268505 RepID=A0A2A9PI54_OPHUN|nr:hypothetical protein XA68_10768 [Ophiocordyceps unilateralis]
MGLFGLVAALVVALMASRVAAADQVGDGLSVWAVAVYMTHGETTPLLAGHQPVLTPEGAQQMWRQGRAFRRRYLSPGGNSSIPNMSVDAIDNRQLAVASRNKAWVAGGALAFIQGLYPPRENAAPSDLGRNYAAGDRLIDYPLNGYQYPLVQTLSSQDPSSVGLQGDVGCLAWQQEMDTSFLKRQDIGARIEATAGIYEALFSSQPLQGTVPLEQANYVNALEVYNLVNYLYAHNETVFRKLGNAKEVISVLNTLAYSSERDKTGYNGTADDSSAVAANASYADIYSIAGRTLATQLARRLATVVGAGGARGKMTLMFGSSRPLISFLSVAGLLTRQNVASGPLSHLPGPGAALVLEVVSDAGAEDGRSFPRTSDLRVRFSYKPSADANETLTTYPLFGSGLDGATIPYTAFIRHMADRGTTVSQWCHVCHSYLTSPWCAVRPERSSSGNGSAIIAVLGSALVVFVIAFLGVVFCLRKEHTRCDRKKPVFKPFGGFRGAQKGPSDADVDISQGGTREARTGSWEMRQGIGLATSNANAGGIVTRNFSTPSAYRQDDDCASLSGLPVKPRETV